MNTWEGEGQEFFKVLVNEFFSLDSNSAQRVNGVLQKLMTESHMLTFLNACNTGKRANKSATSAISVRLLIESWVKRNCR